MNGLTKILFLLLVLAGMEFRSLPGDHGVPPRTNAASPGVIAAHHLERLGDRVTNIGEDVVFLATGRVEDLNP